MINHPLYIYKFFCQTVYTVYQIILLDCKFFLGALESHQLSNLSTNHHEGSGGRLYDTVHSDLLKFWPAGALLQNPYFSNQPAQFLLK